MSPRNIILISIFASCLSAGVLSFFITSLNHNGNTNNKDDSALLLELNKINATLARIEKQGLQPKQNTQPASAMVSTKNRPSLGRADAPITIVEYSDYQCPFCKKFVDNTLPGLKQKYIDTGKVRLVFKDMPLGFHNNAMSAANAAQCVGEQGNYWAMHDELFKNTKNLQEKSFSDYALQAGIEINKFNECFTSKRYQNQIEADIVEAKKVSISGTPTFVIGKTTSDIVTGDVIRGAQPLESLQIIIDRQLGKL